MAAISEGLLGLEFRDGNKLFVDPSMPTNWGFFNATHKRGTATYRIEVKNPEHISKGIRSVHVDGVEMPLAVYLKEGITLNDDGKTHVVKVLMGAP